MNVLYFELPLPVQMAANAALQALRYFLFAGLAYAAFWVYFKKWAAPRKIQTGASAPTGQRLRTQTRLEIFRSIRTFFIFSLWTAWIYWAYHAGLTRIYTGPHPHGAFYPFLSFILLVLFHDFYFYALHRILHTPWLLKNVHSVHHESRSPTPWTAYSFHPIEALLQSAVIPIAVFFLPLHPLTILAFLFFTTFENVRGHLGHEILPLSWRKHPIFGKLILLWNSTTHHDMHHERFQCNYGLYLNLWDRVFRSNHTEYWERVRGEKPSANAVPRSRRGLAAGI